MAKDAVIKLNIAEIREFLCSEEVQKLVKDYADEIQQRAGDGYESSVYVGRFRARASVKAMTRKAKQDNLKNNTLLKAMRK